MQVHVIGTLAVPTTGAVIGEVLTYTAGGPSWEPSAGGGGGSLDSEAVLDLLATSLVNGANITITPNDGANTIQIAVTGLTKATVGLPLVDNTADADKPISTAVAAALGGKASTADLAAKADVSALAGKADASAVAGLAVDTAVVHKSGAETITGVKTFSSAPVVPAGSFPIDRIIGLQAQLDALAGQSTEIPISDITDESSDVPALITGRRLRLAVDGFNGGIEFVLWNKATASWDLVRTSARIHIFVSVNDPAAPQNPGQTDVDMWWRHKAAVTP